MGSEQTHYNRPLSAAGKTMVVLFLCAGVAFVGALRADTEAVARRGADPMAGYFDKKMPRYPGVTELPAGPSTLVGGSRMRMSTFDTGDDPLKVARFYQSRFCEAGMDVVRFDITHKGGVVSAVTPKRGRVYQVLLEQRGERTRAFPSVTDAPLSAKDTARVPPPVPLYPRSVVVLALQSGGVGRAARIVMSKNNGTLDENLAHYRLALSSAGYRQQNRHVRGAQKLAPGHRLLVYYRKGSEVTVALTAADEGTRVHITEVRSGP